MENRLFLFRAATRWAALLCLCFLPLGAWAQKWAVATNLVDYANFATLNMEGSVALDRHWSVEATAKYNPFQYTRGEAPLSAKQQLYAAGTRYWPWHVYSGWWAAVRLQYQEYNRGGIRSPQTREGDRYGMGLSGGFSYMLHPRLNLDFGVGFWGGYDRYVVYSCPVCGITESGGEGGFLLPNDLMVSLVYVF